MPAKLFLALWVAACPLIAARPLAAQSQARVDSGVAVPMRDGVVLRADIYRPSVDGKFPVLVYRTPYSRVEAPPDPIVMAAVRRGYTVVLQDVRGRYGSDGTFEPYRQEGKDGYDTIEWAAHQPWSNGAIGTFGLSYPGAVQWLAAVESPPSLKAMVPAMTFSTPESFWYSGGVWDGSWLDWTWLNIAPDLRRRLGVFGPKTDEEAARSWDREGDRARRYRPMLGLPQLQGVTPWYFEWMRHPPGDDYWSFARLPGRYDRVNAAVLNLSGWFDEMYGPSGAVENFQGAGDALILGPWTHGVASTQRTRAGERDFGPTAALDYDGVVLSWMDRHLKGVNTAKTGSPVQVFVMGANQWRGAEHWPIPGIRPETYYFHLGRGGSRFNEGSIGGMKSSKLVEFVLRSDPAHPVTDPYNGRFGAHDYRQLNPGPSIAVFETPPFQEPFEIIGRVEIELSVTASVPDFDLWVQLYDAGPGRNGRIWNLSSPGTALQRASYRNGGPKRELVKPGETVTLRMDKLVTANRFLPGHALRVVITPQFYPLFSVNPQNRGLEFDSDSVQSGEIRIGLGGIRVSKIVLPVLRPTR